MRYSNGLLLRYCAKTKILHILSSCENLNFFQPFTLKRHDTLSIWSVVIYHCWHVLPLTCYYWTGSTCEINFITNVINLRLIFFRLVRRLDQITTLKYPASHRLSIAPESYVRNFFWFTAQITLTGNGPGVPSVNRGGWLKCLRVNNKTCTTCKCQPTRYVMQSCLYGIQCWILNFVGVR